MRTIIRFFAAVLCLGLNTAGGQTDGSYSVSETWSVTIYRGPGNAATKFTGTETGTILITNGVYSQISHAGSANLSSLRLIRSIDFDFNSGDYIVSGAYPISGVGGIGVPGQIYGIVQLSFFVVAIQLGQTDLPNPWPSRSSVFTTIGASLSSLTGTGKMVDQQANTSGEPSYYINEADASSTARLSYVGPPPQGSLKVTITPSAAVKAGAQWQVDGGLYQNSGATVTGLYAGNHLITFNPASGFYEPLAKTVKVVANQTLVTNGAYAPIPVGALTVTISPAAAATAGGEWQVDGGNWQHSGTTVSNLVVGAHTVAFSAINGWSTPSNQSVTISTNSTTTATGNYLQQTGSLQVNVGPAGAIAAGALWQVDGGALEGSGTIVSNLVPGNHTVKFSVISDWNAPSNQTVTISGEETNIVFADYSYLPLAQFNWTTNNGSVAIAGYTGPGGAVVIPDVIDGLPVSALGRNLFLNNSIVTTINIGSNLTTVGESAFLNCGLLTALNVGPNNPAFSSLSGVLFDKSQTTLLDYPCSRPGPYTIPNGVTIIGDGAFAYLADNAPVSFAIPSSVTNIGGGAFAWCINVTNFTLPEGLVNVGTGAFQGCYRVPIFAVPASVTNIGDAAFTEDEMTAINVAADNGFYTSADGALFNKSQTRLIQYPTGNSRNAYTIPEGVVSIGDYAFENVELAKLIIASTVTNIESDAFFGSFLRSITIPDHVINIGAAAFSYSSYLTNIALGDGLQNLGRSAFLGCPSLSGVYFHGNAPGTNADVFSGDSTLAAVYYYPGASGWGSTFDGFPAVMLNAPNPAGSLQVTIGPPAAVATGAYWKVDGGIPQPSGATVVGLSAGNHTVTFSTTSGWITPSNQIIAVGGNSTATANGTYLALLPPQVTTTALPNGTTAVTYTEQLSAMYGQPPYNWSLVSGSLPPGLTLALGGLLSGTPTASGTFNFTVQVTDALSEAATQALALAVASSLQTFTSLHSFGVADGGNVQSGLMQGWDGSLYGMTSFGGASFEGTVYKLSTGSGYSLAVLRSFSGGVGYGAGDGLVQGIDGNFYGVSPFSGSPTTNGIVFRISPVGPSYTFTILHSFNGSDGRFPIGRLVQGRDGNFYGTTVYGGTNGDHGTVFRINPIGPNYTLELLHSFGGSDGQNPIAGLVQGGDGNFYGSTEWGGNNGWGTIFRVSPAGPNYTLRTLHSFTGADGETPAAELVQGSDGNFYGTTTWGGLYGQGNGDGTVFRISPVGPGYSLTTLHSFSGPDGLYPNGLVQGSDGDFYGTTYKGGTNGGYGSVFQISPTGPDYAFASLHSFGGSDGQNPNAALVQAADGSFYGTTYGGGTNGGHGTVFRISVPLANPPQPINRITAIQFLAGNAMLSINSIAGETYQLQFASSLAPANWSNVVGAAITNSIGAAITITNSGGSNPAQMYYRVKITL